MSETNLLKYCLDYNTK